MRPLTTRPARPRYRTMARATVDFPHPDSPTKPSASPAPRAKLSPGITTDSPARPRYEMRTSRSSRRGAAPVSVTQAQLPQPDREQAEADDEGRDGDARDQRHVGPHRHHAVGVLHHPAPVGVGRREP